MIKHTIEVSSAPTHLCTSRNQLLLKRDGEVVSSIPCEDVGVLLVDHPQSTYTHAALTSLLDSQAAVVICGSNHLPQGLLLPLADHSQIVWRIEHQLSASAPLKKRLWKQIVQTKIRQQAANLDRHSPPYRKLMQFAREVRSGDPANREAQAAKVYWSAWLVNADVDDQRADTHFRRNRHGAPPNALLNYGYAVLRAAVARALVGAGLLPAVGIHHSNRSNAFCLADDLLEPLRPIVDRRVRALYWDGHEHVNRTTKQALLELLAAEVQTDGQTGPVLVALNRLAASLAQCYQGARKSLEIPVPCS